MALWQIMKSGVPTGAIYDDGGTARPGEAAFSTDAVVAHLATLGEAGDGFNFVGVPEAEAVEA